MYKFSRVLAVSQLDENVSASGFQALSKLDHLEQFYFCSIKNASTRKHLELCLQYLPKLRFAGENFSPHFCIFYNSLGKLTTEALLSLKTPTILGLQKMSLFRVERMPEEISLPNLNHLILEFPLENFRCDDPRLSQVTKLCLYEGTTAAAVQILGHLGRQLKKLELCASESVPFDLILESCPNLEWFSYIKTKTFTNAACYIEPDTLRHLKCLELSSIESQDTSSVADPGLLLQLLRAPELRRLKVSLYALQQKEMDKIVHLIQQGNILQKLELAMIEAFHDSVFNALHEAEAKQVNLLLSEMAVNCPCLYGVFDRIVHNSLGNWKGDV